MSFHSFLISSFPVDQKSERPMQFPAIQVTLWTKCHLYFYFYFWLIEHKEVCPLNLMWLPTQGANSP